MRIKRISLWRQQLTSHLTYNMADGKVCDTVETVILRLDGDNGLCGWGEVCPIPHYLPAYAGGVGPALAEMAPILLGDVFSAPEEMMDRLDAHLLGHGYAKSAVDTALWDLMARAAGLPLYALLGGLRARDLPLYHSISCLVPEEMARLARESPSAGHRSVASQAWRRQ